MKKFKNKNAITLVALVITIISCCYTNGNWRKWSYS